MRRTGRHRPSDSWSSFAGRNAPRTKRRTGLSRPPDSGASSDRWHARRSKRQPRLGRPPNSGDSSDRWHAPRANAPAAARPQPGTGTHPRRGWCVRSPLFAAPTHRARPSMCCRFNSLLTWLGPEGDAAAQRETRVLVATRRREKEVIGATRGARSLLNPRRARRVVMPRRGRTASSGRTERVTHIGSR